MILKFKVKRKLLFVAIITSIAIQSCSKIEKNNSSDKTTTNNLPALTESQLGALMAKVEKTEVTFYGNVQVSMNVDQHGALSFMKNITEQTVDDLSCAKAQGRMFMIGNGESLADVEFCISQSCHYYIFYIDGEKYANPFPEENAVLLRSMMNSKIENRPL